VRRLSVTLGVICLVVGGIWIFQGSGILPGSFMTGQRQWLWIGIAVDVIGLLLAYYGLRRQPGRG
jgi:hypothetical protein